MTVDELIEMLGKLSPEKRRLPVVDPFAVPIVGWTFDDHTQQVYLEADE